MMMKPIALTMMMMMQVVSMPVYRSSESFIVNNYYHFMGMFSTGISLSINS